MLHIIKTGQTSEIQIEPSGLLCNVILSIRRTDQPGEALEIESVEFLTLDQCQALIFALTETTQRIRAAA